VQQRLFVGRVKDHNLVLNTAPAELQLKLKPSIVSNLPLRLIKFPELHEGSARTIIFNQEKHVYVPNLSTRPRRLQSPPSGMVAKCLFELGELVSLLDTIRSRSLPASPLLMARAVATT
jgi:hypothetical protein